MWRLAAERRLSVREVCSFHIVILWPSCCVQTHGMKAEKGAVHPLTLQIQTACAAKFKSICEEMWSLRRKAWGMRWPVFTVSLFILRLDGGTTFPISLAQASKVAAGMRGDPKAFPALLCRVLVKTLHERKGGFSTHNAAVEICSSES